MKLSDYVADLLIDNNINDVFSVVGGMSMHLNDSFHYNDRLRCTYNHHEQACAIAAESYYKATNKIACVCVTSGPGGTNTLTGVLCAYLDNIPMIILSGQVMSHQTIQNSGLDIRQFGEQEHNIVDTVKNMTKYAVMITKASDIKYEIEKALFIAKEGRKGPVWIDIPLDIQNSNINIDKLEGFIEPAYPENIGISYNEIIDKIKESRSPVLIAGSAVRSLDNIDYFYELVNKLNIPILCPTSICDIFENDNKLYYGNFGIFGSRTGNFIIQNSDLIISLGCRMTFKHTGFNHKEFANNAYKIVVDADKNELEKGIINIDIPINSDISIVINGLNKNIDNPLELKEKWIKYCDNVYNEFSTKIYKDTEKVNPYIFIKIYNDYIKNDKDIITVVGNSCSCVAALQHGINKLGQKLYGNVNCGTMGYDLPAAIGAAKATNKIVVCITGDGSIMMNLQELMTIEYNYLNIKIIIFNNNGYGAIKHTQSNFFNQLSGCDQESGILFPHFGSMANALDIPYKKIENNHNIYNALQWIFYQKSYCILEIIEDESFEINPRIKSKKDEYGNLYQPPIDDLSPFLTDEEYNKYAKFEDR